MGEERYCVRRAATNIFYFRQSFTNIIFAEIEPED